MGHRSRIEALRSQLERLGWRCDPAPLADGLPDRGVALVVDSYDVRADEVQFDGGPVVAIDDLDRDLAVDLLVEPSPPVTSTAGARPTGRSRVHLAGFEFALVGSAGAAINFETATDTRVGPQVLVTLGGSDTGGWGAAICDRLAVTSQVVRVLHVPGPWSASATNPGVEVAARDVQLMPLLRAATVVVSAGGVTMLESMMTGRPTVAVETADNQHRAVVGAAAAGAVLVAGSADPPDVCAAVGSVLADPVLTDALASRGPQVVDGLGARRVADRIHRMLGHRPA